MIALLVGALSLACAYLLVSFAKLTLQRDHERILRLNLERWLRGNLLQIRGECGFMSSQSLSIVNSIECALPILAPINTRALRADLARIQRERDAYVTEQAQHWLQVRIAAEAAQRQGAELPGFDEATPARLAAMPVIWNHEENAFWKKAEAPLSGNTPPSSAAAEKGGLS